MFLLFLISSFIILNLLTILYDAQLDIYKTYSTQAHVFSETFNTTLTAEMINEYNNSKFLLIVEIAVLELGMIINFLSIMPFQKRMILKYNK